MCCQHYSEILLTVCFSISTMHASNIHPHLHSKGEGSGVKGEIGKNR